MKKNEWKNKDIEAYLKNNINNSDEESITSYEKNLFFEIYIAYIIYIASEKTL